MMDMLKHNLDVIRQAGLMALEALLLLNGTACLLALALPTLRGQGLYFLLGLIAAFMAVLLVWLAAQLLAAGRDVSGQTLLVVQLAPTAAALACFVAGLVSGGAV